MELLKGLARRVLVTIATAIMTLPGMAVGSALAADQLTASSGDQWLKMCRKDDKTKKELCQTEFELRSNDGQFLATFMVVEMTGEARRMARVILPTGMLLQPGLKVQVDQNKPDPALYTFCASDGCISEMLITDAQFASFKKGKMLTIGAEGQSSNPVSFNFPLDTFKTANEGKPLDEAEIQKHVQAIQQEILSKRKSLDDQLKDAQHKAQESE